MNSIFRNLPNKEAKRKRDKIGHFRIAFSADTKSYPVSCQHLSDLWRSTLDIGAARRSLRSVTEITPHGTVLQHCCKTSWIGMLRVLPCCKTGLNVSGKTRNIAIQLAMAVFTLETS